MRWLIGFLVSWDVDFGGEGAERGRREVETLRGGKRGEREMCILCRDDGIGYGKWENEGTVWDENREMRGRGGGKNGREWEERRYCNFMEICFVCLSVWK